MGRISLTFTRRAKTLAYDDTCQVFDDGVLVKSFFCNTQPGTTRTGVATLAPGQWIYRPGIHGLSKPPSRRYPAFVQAAPVKVFRSGSDKLHVVDYSINIHKGSFSSVSSLGCITFAPDVWDDFHSLVLNLLDKNDQPTFQITVRNHGEETSFENEERKFFRYFLNGTEFSPSSILGGRAVVKVRSFIASLRKTDPSLLVFEWKGDNLYFEGKEIETVDVRGMEGVTHGFLSSCCEACNVAIKIDNDSKKVFIPG